MSESHGFGDIADEPPIKMIEIYIGLPEQRLRIYRTRI